MWDATRNGELVGQLLPGVAGGVDGDNLIGLSNSYNVAGATILGCAGHTMEAALQGIRRSGPWLDMPPSPQWLPKEMTTSSRSTTSCSSSRRTHSLLSFSRASRASLDCPQTRGEGGVCHTSEEVPPLTRHSDLQSTTTSVARQ
jgi:hypothetical protein